MDLVKFTWSNKHGYWIPVAWLTCLSHEDVSGVAMRARIGRPGLTDLRVLDRIAIPEELRLTGHSRLMLSKVVLYDPNEASYTAKQMLDAMLVQTA